MNDNLVIDTIRIAFEFEIENCFIVNENEIIVSFNDGSKAKITIKNMK